MAATHSLFKLHQPSYMAPERVGRLSRKDCIESFDILDSRLKDSVSSRIAGVIQAIE